MSGPRGASHGLSPVGTASQPLDKKGKGVHAIKAVPSPDTPENRKLGPPLVRLLTVRQVAASLSVSTATVYALIDRGELAHARVSNAIRVAPADLQAFIAAQKK